MKRIVSGVVVCALVTLASVVHCDARGKAKPVSTPHEIVISSVSGNSITVTDDKTAKTVSVGAFTEITVNGQKATLADLKPGMTVNLTLSSPTQATRITATSKK